MLSLNKKLLFERFSPRLLMAWGLAFSILLVISGQVLAQNSKHQLKGVDCVQCHGDTKKFVEVEKDQCITCHTPEQLVAKTENVQPKNPHNSPHYGTDAECSLCHKEHEPSENYCNQCHTFDFKVP